MVHDLPSFYSFFQEDGSLPDREQVQLFFFFNVDFGEHKWKIPVFHHLDVHDKYMLFT